MALNIRRFNIYGSADFCNDGSLCNWKDVEPYIKEEKQLKDSISTLKGLTEAGKLSASMSSTQVNQCLYAVIAKLESI